MNLTGKTVPSGRQAAPTAAASTKGERLRRHIIAVSHGIMFTLAVLLVGIIAYDTLRNISFISSEFYIRAQFWICLFFIFDVLLEVALRRHRTAGFWLSRIFFLIISVPYISIIDYTGYHLTMQLEYIVRFVPVFRAAIAIAIVGNAISNTWITGLFSVYLMILTVVTFIGSLMFYVEEHFINPGVPNFGEALWWALMELNTCGSDINPMTPTGQIIAVVLSTGGLILFPVFTVFVTNLLTSRVKTLRGN